VTLAEYILLAYIYYLAYITYTILGVFVIDGIMTAIRLYREHQEMLRYMLRVYLHGLVLRSGVNS